MSDPRGRLADELSKLAFLSHHIAETLREEEDEDKECPRPPSERACGGCEACCPNRKAKHWTEDLPELEPDVQALVDAAEAEPDLARGVTAKRPVRTQDGLKAVRLTDIAWLEFDIPDRDEPYRIDDPLLEVAAEETPDQVTILDNAGVIHVLPSVGVVGTVVRYANKP